MHGVLIASYEARFHLVNETARALGSPEVSPERFRRAWGQGVEADVQAFFPGRTPADIAGEYLRRFQNHRAHLRVNPEARPVLQTLRERGIRTAVITNTPAPRTREILTSAGLAPDFVVGLQDGIRGKPWPDMVLRALELTGAGPSDAIVVGDSRFDQQAAAAAGVRFVGLQRDGDERIENLADLLRLAAQS